LKGIVPLGKVDCTVHASLCQQYQVQGYPTIKIFSEKGKKVTDYQQERQAGAIVRAATDDLPSHVVRIKDTTSLGNFLNQNDEIPHFLLFSSKGDISPLMKSLSVSFKGRVLFGQVKQDVKDVVQKYNVESFPKIMVIKGAEDPVAYEGAINPDELREFVAGYAGETVTQEPVPPPPVRARPSKLVTEVTYIEVNEDNIETVCQGLCILGFVEGETIDDKWAIRAEQQQLLDEILSRFKPDGKFKFGYVDLGKSKLNQKFSLSSDEPSLVVFNGKRQKFIKIETFEFKTAFKTIEHVLTGDAHYTPL